MALILENTKTGIKHNIHSSQASMITSVIAISISEDEPFDLDGTMYKVDYKNMKVLSDKYGHHTTIGIIPFTKKPF